MSEKECERMEALVSACADGELSEEDSAEVSKHLERCESCARRMERYRSLDTKVREAFSLIQPPSRWKQLRESVDPIIDEAAGDARRSGRQRRIIALAVSVSLAAAAALMLVLGDTTEKTPSSPARVDVAAELPDSELLEVDPGEGYTALVLPGDDDCPVVCFLAD